MICLLCNEDGSIDGGGNGAVGAGQHYKQSVVGVDFKIQIGQGGGGWRRRRHDRFTQKIAILEETRTHTVAESQYLQAILRKPAQMSLQSIY